VIAAGAQKLAVVRAIGEAADPERAARALRALLPDPPTRSRHLAGVTDPPKPTRRLIHE
jgi:hypothetical protein